MGYDLEDKTFEESDVEKVKELWNNFLKKKSKRSLKFSEFLEPIDEWADLKLLGNEAAFKWLEKNQKGCQSPAKAVSFQELKRVNVDISEQRAELKKKLEEAKKSVTIRSRKLVEHFKQSPYHECTECHSTINTQKFILNLFRMPIVPCPVCQSSLFQDSNELFKKLKNATNRKTKYSLHLYSLKSSREEPTGKVFWMVGGFLPNYV